MTLYSTTILQDSPAAYYRLGELSGTTAADGSGNGHAGTYTGGCTLGQAGLVSGDNDAAIALDGSTGYVRIPNAAALQIDTPTLECWFRSTSADGQAHMTVNKGDGAGAWFLGLNPDGSKDGQVGIYFDGPSAAGSWLFSPLATYNDGLRHHLAASWDGTTIRLYVDGVLVNSRTSTTAFSPNALDIFLGTRDAESATYFAGILDEVAVYPVALAAARILAHYNAGLVAGSAAPVIARAVLSAEC